MTDIFGNALSIAGSFMDSDLVNRFMMVIFAVILVFGVLNCILGYRLLRFWMMLGGFLVGGGLALVVVHTMGIQEKSTMLIAALAAGVVFAVIAFLIYKAGVFILAAGIGWAASIYFLHPTSSAVFFACILIGVALGSMAVKYCREVLIVATSLIGGIMAGVSLAQLGNLADIPYGLGMSVGFAVLGMLIQFAINKPVSDEEDEETVDEESTEQIYRRNQDLRQDQSFEQSQDRDMEESIYARGQKGQARKMAKEAKTNAMRMLDRQKVKYEAFSYECDEFIDGVHSADKIGAPYDQSFKTLVMEGKSGGYFVFVVPIEKEVDRKAAAKAVGEKTVDMIHVKDITKITGYVRGGCSPLGMKKPYPVVFDASAGEFEEIYVSGGRIGLTLKVPLADLLKVTGGKLADIIMKTE